MATPKILWASFILAGSLLIASCGNNNEAKNDDDELVVDSTAYENTGALGVSDFAGAKDYPGATLDLKDPVATAAGDSVKVDFNFVVKNYSLGAQTPDAAERGCANSKDGQHIHFILNGAPYTALYKPTHSVTLAKNTEHYVLCFLSRSYHESIKDKSAAVLRHFKIDENGKYVSLDIPATPMIFYSRPKGDYVGADTANLLLDYYLWNTTLGSDVKVKATITNAAGATASTTLDSWAAKKINGLTMGKNKVELSLTDANNQPLSGPNTTGSREFNLSAGEPLTP